MPYNYQKSVKSEASDEPINTYLIRPLAGILVRLVYNSAISPNQLTMAAIFIGFAASVFYYLSPRGPAVAAGLCLMLKDVVDSADGQLARAKGLTSRAGRFVDSIGDFFVNAAVFAAIAATLYERSGDWRILVLGALAFASTTLRISYHVFYHTSYLHLQKTYQTNRLSEEIRDEDLTADRLTLRLQQVFQLLYGWQDRWMAALNVWCLHGSSLTGEQADQWYGNVIGLRLVGFMGLGTELFVLTLFSVAGFLEGYLWFNVLGLNLLWVSSVAYRRRLAGR